MNHTTRFGRALAIAAVVLTTALLAGCGQTANDTKSATAGLPDLEQSLMAHQWVLDIDDDASAFAASSARPVSLVFDSATAASGTAPCNTYRAGVTLEGDDSVRFDDPATTLLGCDPAAMTAEAAYLAILAKIRTADVTDRDRLVLTGDDGARLVFTTASP